MADERPHPSPLPPKPTVARSLLAEGGMFVHLDPRCPGVVVPRWLTQQPQLILHVDARLSTLDDGGLRTTLTSRRTTAACTIPWSAVYALIGERGRGLIWPDDVPVEVTPSAAQSRPARAAARRPRPKLARLGTEPPPPGPSRPPASDAGDPGGAVVPVAPTSPIVAEGSGPSRAARRPLPPYLRVIK